ncbi:Dnaaf5 [Scenedesmus sp. PABB004]|nr:Dnaaf5 [Scenedesmus sp. PABB004]
MAEPAKTRAEALWAQLNAGVPPGRSAKAVDVDRPWASDAARRARDGGAAAPARRRAAKLDPYLSRLLPRQPAGQQETGGTPVFGAAAPASVPAALGGGCLEGGGLERVLQALLSPAAGARRAALAQIQAALDCAAAPGAEAAAASVAAASTQLGKALLRRFEDASEACREAAVAAFASLLAAAAGDGVLPLLPYAMPVLEERLHADEASGAPAEPSEEIRLALARLLGALIAAAGSAVAAYASEVWSMLAAALADPYHEVALRGCAIAQQLAATLGLRLGGTAKEVVAALLPLTTHSRHRVRVAAVEAVRDVVQLAGAHEALLGLVGWRDPNLVPVRAFYEPDVKTGRCRAAQVRLAFVQAVGAWLLRLPERRDHEARLLPYLISGLADDAPCVVSAALGLLDDAGALYEAEHAADLADALRFGAAAADEDEAALVAAVGAGALAYAGGSAEGGAEAEPAAAPPAAFRLPGPFAARPRLGARLLARNNFGSSLPALCAELGSWQSAPRGMAARLLLVSLALVESAAERHLQVLLPALCAAVRDADAGGAVADCAALLGVHCSFGLVLELLAPRVTDGAGDARRQADALLVLAAVLRGAVPVGRLQGHVLPLLELLLAPGVGDSADSGVRAAATAVAQQLLAPGPAAQMLAGARAEGEAPGAEAPACPAAPPQRAVLLLAQLLLQLGAWEGQLAGGDAGAAAALVDAARAQAVRAEALLGSLACAAGFASTDGLLAHCCAGGLLARLCPHGEPPRPGAATAVCRLLLPSGCAWVLTAQQPAFSVVLRELPALGGPGGAAEGQPRLAPFAPDALPGCAPEHLGALLALVAAAERRCGPSAQHTPPHVQTLLAALDACLQAWPAAGFAPGVLRQLLRDTAPALLGSGRGLPAMAGLRALMAALLRGLLRPGEHGACELVAAWERGLCGAACALLASGGTAAVRLQACCVARAAAAELGARCLLPALPGAGGAEEAPQPAAALAAALDDADADVRAAAAAALTAVLRGAGGGGGAGAGGWAEALRRRLAAAGSDVEGSGRAE